MVTEEDLALGGGYTMQYTDYVSQNGTLEINVTPINLIKKRISAYELQVHPAQ